LKIYKKYLLVLILAIGSTLCSRYKSVPLKRFNQNIDVAGQQTLSFNYKVLTTQDCKKYFNSRAIIKKGYQPVYVSFTNNTSFNCAVSLDSFSFRCANYQDVANSLHRNGMMRGVCFGLAAPIFLPLIIPAFIQGLGAGEYNELMDIDFAYKAFKNRIVSSYAMVDGVVFAATDQFCEDFTITVKMLERNNFIVVPSVHPRVIV